MIQDSKLRALIAPSDDELRSQLADLVRRSLPESGRRQVNFSSVEVLLCLAASRVVRWNSYGGNNSHEAPRPVPELARLFKRSPGSITSKMGNLFGGRANQGKSETEAAEWYLADPSRLDAVYERILSAAAEVGIGKSRLPDFMPLTPSP